MTIHSALWPLIVLPILYTSAAIAGVGPPQNVARSPAGNAFWVPRGSGRSNPSALSSQPPAAPPATNVAKPSGAPVLSPYWNLALPNLDGSLASPLIYPIPNTDKALSFTSINAPLPGPTVLMCFLQASEYILQKTVMMRKDGFIDKGRFTSQFLNGTTDSVLITVQDQIETGQKVTYGTLAIALRGLGQFMTAQNSFFEATFNITDGPWGQVGYGSIIGNQFTAAS